MTREKAIEVVKKNYPHVSFSGSQFESALRELVPELAESEDERIRKWLVDYFTEIGENWIHREFTCKQIVAYLEKQKEQKPIQENLSYEELVRNAEEEVNVLYPNNEEEGTEAWYRRECLREHYMKGAVRAAMEILDIKEQKEQKPSMIQWKGDNLKEVIDFTGKSPMFNKWFKSFEDYEEYVHSHGNIFKLFNEDGAHYEVPVGAWIVKTPDGCNVASKAVFRQKTAEWSEEDDNAIWSALRAWCEKKGITPFELYPKENQNH